MITATATNPKVTTSGGEYVFRATFIDPFQGTVLAKYASEDLKAKNAAVLYDVGNDYSTGLADAFKKAFEGAGGKVVSYETYSTGDQDFSAQLTKIKANKPEVLVLPDYYNVVGLIAKQARSQGITATLLGGDGWDSPDLFKVGGTAINGGYFSNHYSPQSTLPEAVAFRDAYKAKYNATPDAFGALAYDAGQILFNAITKAGSTDGPKIREQLVNTDITIVSGRIRFNENRDPIKPAVIIKTENNTTTFVKSVAP
jgi:branched-chain amino acid transport system substrate-binding protein